jgi:hypothetical protein
MNSEAERIMLTFKKDFHRCSDKRSRVPFSSERFAIVL